MKNIYSISVICFFLVVFFGKKANAQDPHFSQFYNAPMQLNPALAGLIQGDTRATVNYRSQWSSIATPFQTMAGAVDFRALNYLTKKDIFGAGVFVMNDVAGEADLRNTQVGLSFAYNMSMTDKRNHFIGIGAQYLFVQQSLEYTKLRFESQYNGEVIDPTQASGENLAMNSFSYFDFNAGISWSYRYDRFRSYYAGAAISHLNQPKVSFFDDLAERLKMKYTFYAGADFKISPNISFIPRGVFLLQGTAKEISIGGLVKFNVGNTRAAQDKTAIYFGTMHRFQDAQVIMMRYDYDGVGLSFSYDMNISKLNVASKGRGAIEIALVFETEMFERKRYSKVECPKF